ncbi:unannotated protein [freshwater metagenome]|jgi:hypothetical protein|uniref:Unannotated protein n=1 Tax=freshwater metagenome TaxID=449393 RepID=A0A6J6JQ55_9ZZZZ|nr:hypothetical protein [Actinomycetota bacterium]
MSRLLFASLSLGLALTLGGCAATPMDGNISASTQPTPTPDQALAPSAPPAELIEVDPAAYSDGFDWFSFKVGDGPTWCTITPMEDRVLCEQNEAAAQYQPVPPPAECEGSYGYQVQLWANTPEIGEIAEFACASGQFQDPTAALVLPSGSKITVGSITCFVEEITARCDNQSGQWIALGPAVWSINS